jgi:hypothetical protein
VLTGGFMVRSNQVLLFLAFTFALTACGEVSFSPSKSSTLNSKRGFSDDGDANGEINQPGGRDGDSEGRIDQPREPNAVFIERVCSNARTEKAGNLYSAAKVVLVTRTSKGAEVCPGQTKDYRADLINMDKLTFTLPCALPDGKYEAEFYDVDRLDGDEPLADFNFDVKNGAVQISTSKIEVTYATNAKEGDEDRQAHHELCEKYASPLVVKLGSEAIRLSSPLDGILFDILGSAATDGFRQISWVSDESFAFISLPAADGTVSGIDELFGDNTLGPDGKYAANGYEALAKYDDNADGRIDSNDAVYTQLRLWIDRDRDGASSDTELETLEDRGITAIDLIYDAGYSERDQYGNKILYKSIAERAGADPLLVFDIWFRTIL